MRLSTIWTLPGMAFPERLRRTRDWAARAVAHRMPRRLAYWTLIDTGGRHVGHTEPVPDASFLTVLQRAHGDIKAT